MSLETDVTETQDPGLEQPEQVGEQQPGGEQSQGGTARGADGRFQGQRPAQSAPAKLKLKVKSKSGGDEELELTHEEIAQRLSLHQEAHHRMRQTAEDRKKLDAERAALQREREQAKELFKNPAEYRKWLREQMQDPAEAHRLLVQALRMDLEEQKLSPEERELRELRAEKEERERTEQERQETEAREKVEAELRQKVEALRPAFVKELTGILDKGGIPVTDGALARMATAWRDNKKDGLGLSEDELAAYVKDELDSELNARMGDQSLTDDAFEQRFPDVMKRAERILRAKIQKRRAGAQGGVQRQGASVGAAPDRREQDGLAPPRKTLSRKEEAALFGDLL